MTIDAINSNKIKKPIVLIILDGWGLSPTWGGNAIAMNNPPNINRLWRNYKHTVLQAFKPIAGESAKIANSEIGHASIGTGRMIEPDINEINNSIKDKSFFENNCLIKTCKNVIENKSSLHLIGLISDGNVHSSINHLYALMEFAKKFNVKNLYIHAITDGRDVPSTSAISFITKIENKIQELGIGKIASICGRSYAMDRNKNWKNIEIAYKAQVYGIGKRYNNSKKAISNLYKENFTDENIPPSVIYDGYSPVGNIKDHDSIIFFNFRADRAQELTRAYLDKNVFKSMFSRKYKLPKINFVSFTDYKLNYPNLEIAFQSAKIDSNLSKILSQNNLKQLHISESEKYAHITYFFNGGYSEPFAGEDRIIVKSPNVSYEKYPEMSSNELTKKVLFSLRNKKYDFILINIPNVDMVGHTGNILATSEAVKIVDEKVSKIVDEALKKDGTVIVTADHGNAEQMINVNTYENQKETLHSLNPVPFILISKDTRKNLFKSAYKSNDFALSEVLFSKYTLADIAPTILEILNISKPVDMTGHSLLNKLT